MGLIQEKMGGGERAEHHIRAISPLWWSVLEHGALPW